MPIITPSEVEELIPALQGKNGQKIVKFLFNFLGVDKLNDIFDKLSDKTGPDFTKSFLEEEGVDYMVGNPTRLDKLPDGPFITISNHPYGSLDGIMLIDIFGHIRDDYKVMVNLLLSKIKTLTSNFITVIPTMEKRVTPLPESIKGVKMTMEHLRNGSPVGLFPAGGVSDLSLMEGCVKDRQWQEPVLRMIQKAKVPIVPVRMFDGNSLFYYLLGLISWKLRLFRLPAEAMNKRGTTNRVGIGKIITVDEQNRYKDLEEFSNMLRASVYGMKMPEQFALRSELF